MTTATTAATTATDASAVIPQVKRSRAAWVLSDALVLTKRYVSHIVRQPDEIITAVMIPTTMMLLFRYMLGGGAVDVGAGAYVDFLVPGVLTVGVTLVAVSTTTGVFMDMQEGFVDRLRSMRTAAVSVIVAHVVASVLRALISLTVLIGLAFVVGFRPSAGLLQWLGALAILLLFAFAVAWISVLFGQIAKSNAGASGMALILTFAPYSSNLFAPTETISPGLRTFVEHQPVTAVIDTVRALLLDQPVGNSAWIAVAWWGGITALVIPISARKFRRRYS
ncbi:ABC transporter permease [Streptomyces sp. NPDC056503]|uniref:ABC transporter permease n=1 Tax=Streptomyces sp. NPDC056503 TaxID=3345842 RepID=UPI0036ACB578